MVKQRPQRSDPGANATFAPGWYIIGRSNAVGPHPRPTSLNGIPLVTFRDSRGRFVSLLDRCPHRNAPLSAGRVEEGRIECHYHGWQFDSTGVCRAVPGLVGEPDHPTRRVPSFACLESQGWIWVYSEPNVTPDSGPYEIPHADQPGYSTLRECLEMPGPVQAIAENALDVPHTAFVHAGLFRRNEDRKPIDVVVRPCRDGVEAEFIGEERPRGWLGRLLAPGGGEVFHCDRFLLPSIAQVEYRLGERSHIIATAALTPQTRTRTKLFATVAAKLPIPNLVLHTLLRAVAMRILKQDTEIVRRQTEQVAHFGGAEFTSTEIDFLGLRIEKLLRDAAAGRPHATHDERRFKMLI